MTLNLHLHTGLLCIYVPLLIQWRHVDRHLYCFLSMLSTICWDTFNLIIHKKNSWHELIIIISHKYCSYQYMSYEYIVSQQIKNAVQVQIIYSLEAKKLFFFKPKILKIEGRKIMPPAEDERSNFHSVFTLSSLV